MAKERDALRRDYRRKLRLLIWAISEVQNVGKKLLEHKQHIYKSQEIESVLQNLNRAYPLDTHTHYI